MKLDYNLSVEDNASLYFEKAKKARAKAEGAREAVELMEKKLAKIEKDHKAMTDELEKKRLPKRKPEWFEKFRWFYSSEGSLVIGGRDATTNEIIVKKHTEKDDLVFHTEMSGSPFFVVKGEAGKSTIEETAIATASFSKAWKNGLSSLDVFYVKPNQVSKEAESGEYMSKGSFMIRGKRTNINALVKLFIGIKDGVPMCGAEGAVKANCEKVYSLEQGKNKPSDIAKKLRKDWGTTDLDEIIRILPAGGLTIKKQQLKSTSRQ